MPIVILLHILLLSKIQYIAWPENFVWPYLNFSGLTLYKDLFFIYPPAYPLLLEGWFKITGLSLVNLQILSYLVIGFTDVLLFLAAKKKIWPVLIYIPLQIFFEGNGLWPDQLLAPIFLAAWLFFSRKRYFYLGIILGLAMLTKQTASYFVLGLALLAIRNWKHMLAGSMLVLVFAGLYFFLNHSFADFFQQNVVYIFAHHVGNSLQTLWPNRQQIAMTALVFIPAAAIGIYKRRFQETVLMVLAGLGIFTRFEYFHLQPALPFAALLLGASVWSRPIVLGFVLIFIKFAIRTHDLPARFYTQDVLDNASRINIVIPRGASTMILNSWDHYYFLTGTVPVGNFFFSSTPWNWSYDGLQEKEVAILRDTTPQYVVYGSCFKIKDTCYRPDLVGQYIRAYYEEVLKLPDGTGVFKNNPVSLGKIVQPPNGQK